MKLFRVLLHVKGIGTRDVIVIARTVEGAFDLAELEVMEREHVAASRIKGAMGDVVEVILDSARIVAYEDASDFA